VWVPPDAALGEAEEGVKNLMKSGVEHETARTFGSIRLTLSLSSSRCLGPKSFGRINEIAGGHKTPKPQNPKTPKPQNPV